MSFTVHWEKIKGAKLLGEQTYHYAIFIDLDNATAEEKERITKLASIIQSMNDVGNEQKTLLTTKILPKNNTNFIPERFQCNSIVDAFLISSILFKGTLDATEKHITNVMDLQTEARQVTDEKEINIVDNQLPELTITPKDDGDFHYISNPLTNAQKLMFLSNVTKKGENLYILNGRHEYFYYTRPDGETVLKAKQEAAISELNNLYFRNKPGMALLDWQTSSTPEFSFCFDFNTEVEAGNRKRYDAIKAFFPVLRAQGFEQNKDFKFEGEGAKKRLFLVKNKEVALAINQLLRKVQPTNLEEKQREQDERDHSKPKPTPTPASVVAHRPAPELQDIKLTWKKTEKGYITTLENGTEEYKNQHSTFDYKNRNNDLLTKDFKLHSSPQGLELTAKDKSTVERYHRIMNYIPPTFDEPESAPAASLIERFRNITSFSKKKKSSDSP